VGFEFDLNKSRENLEKHGISFEAAQMLWLDSLAIMGPANSKTEERFLFIGSIANTIWAAIVTFRGPNIRIISVRRARSEEREIYENQ